MSYANVQDKIRLEARRDASERAVELRDKLEEMVGMGDPVRPPYVDRELQHLERIANSTKPGSKLRQVVQQCSDLANRLPAKKKTAVGAMLADALKAPSPEEVSPSHGHVGALGSLSPGGRSYLTTPVLARGRPQDSFKNATESFGMGSSNCDLAAVASFLLPQMSEGEGNDECRAMACEQKLVFELGKFPVIHYPGQQAVVIRSWKGDDDISKTNIEQVSILTLQQAAADVREISQLVADYVEEASEPIAGIAANVAQTAQNADLAFQELANAHRSNARMWKRAAGPSVGLIVFGIVALTPGGIPVAIGAGVASGGVGHIGARKVAEWQERAVMLMQNAVERTRGWTPMRNALADRLYQDAQEAQRRLADFAPDGWKPVKLSLRGYAAGLKVLWKDSLSQKAGSFAYRATFRTGLSAHEAFAVLEDLRVQGALDPGCRAMWTRQVDDQGTFIRMTIFKEWFKNRNFFNVGHSSRLSGDAERYVYAHQSVAPDLVDEVLPLGEGADEGAWGSVAEQASMNLGQVLISGVYIHDPNDGEGTQVDLISDIDQSASGGDSVLRGHVIAATEFLRQACVSYATQSEDESPLPSPR